MVARAATAGLSTADLELIREALAAGRKQRVQFTDSAGQIAGQVGHVVALADPEASDEWVVVRFGRDELPFAPTDLTLPRTNGKRSATAPALKLVESPVSAQVPTPRRGRTETGRTETGRTDAAQKPVLKSVPSTVDASPTPPVPQPERRPVKKVAKPKPPTTLTVTLSYVDGDWTVAAHQGSKVLAKPYLIKASDALKMVALLDVAGVQEAVEHVIAAERVSAEQKLQRLRDELAELEARLTELGLPR